MTAEQKVSADFIVQFLLANVSSDRTVATTVAAHHTCIQTLRTHGGCALGRYEKLASALAVNCHDEDDDEIAYFTVR